MRIVSLNAWGGAMFGELSEWIPAVHADVLCLQEVTRTPGTSGWTTFEDGERRLPQRADLFTDIARLMPSHQSLFLASDAGPIVDGEGRRRHQDFGLGTFVSNDLPVIGHDAAFVHSTYAVHDTWPASSRPRIAHGVRVHDPSTGRPVTVVHFHGLRDGAGKHDTAERDGQASRVVTLIERVRDAGDLTVVCGDMNVLPDSQLLQALADLGLENLVGTADTRTSRYRKPTRHASYLLVSDPAAIEQFEILAEPEVSDHRPLVLDI